MLYTHVDPYIFFFFEICLSVWKADIHVMVVCFVFSQKNNKASCYRNRVFDNQEDIVILCGRDRATGVGEEHIDEAIEAMAGEGENEVNSPNA